MKSWLLSKFLMALIESSYLVHYIKLSYYYKKPTADLVKNPDLVKILASPKNFTKSALYCIKYCNQLASLKQSWHYFKLSLHWKFNSFHTGNPDSNFRQSSKTIFWCNKKAGLVSKLTSSCVVAKDLKRQKRLEIGNFLPWSIWTASDNDKTC